VEFVAYKDEVIQDGVLTSFNI